MCFAGTRFIFNMYRHHAVLVMRSDKKVPIVFRQSKEGITHGCPLAILEYG